MLRIMDLPSVANRHLGHDGAIIARGPGNGAAAANLMLKVANNSTLRHLTNRENVANGELGLLAAVNELTSVHSLGGNEQLLLQTMLVHIPELNNSEGSATTRIVDDLLDHTLDVSIALSKVERTELGRALPVLGMGLEH